MKTFVAKIRDSGNAVSYEITIPKAILEYEGLSQGDYVEFSIVSKKNAQDETQLDDGKK